jgi:heat shock protein HtpX
MASKNRASAVSNVSPSSTQVGRDRWLVPRLAAALVVLGLLSLVIAGTGVTVLGLLAWLCILLSVILFSIFIGPVFDAQFGYVSPVVDHAPAIVLGSGLILVPVLYLRPVRAQVRGFRDELGATGEPASETHPEIAAIARRLAQQADIQEPDVYVADRQRAESYAIGGRSNGTIVLTQGLVSDLSRDGLTAVLAHELSHLVNGDSRIMGLAVTPMLLAEHIGSDDPPALKWIVRAPLAYLVSLGAWAALTVFTSAQRASSQLGVAVLSREREFAADRGAAQLTGSPGDLATALETLDGTRTRPDADKRRWARSASALDILPRDEAVADEGPFRTHPRTEKRIQRLEQMAVEMEDRS